jgi:outer membrane protein assembly factor BamE
MMPRHRYPYNPTNPPQNMLSLRTRSLRFGVFGLLLGALLAASGCVYRIDIQQGNFLEPKDLDRVSVGMTRVQVRSLLGTPMVADPFKTERWDYVYYFKRGRLQKPVQRQFTVFFQEDKVTRVDRSGAETIGTPRVEKPDVNVPDPDAPASADKPGTASAT